MELLKKNSNQMLVSLKTAQW